VKIAFVYDLVYPFCKGGVEKRIADLGRLMAARGHEVHLFGTKYWGGMPNRVIDGVMLHGVCEPTDIHTKAGRRSPAQAWRFAIAAAREVGRYDLDVVELQGMSPLTCLAVLVRCRFSKIKPLVVWYEVWRDYWNEYLGLPGYIGRLVEWLVARIAPAQAASSRLAISRLEAWGIHNAPYLPIGIDYQRIQSVPHAALESDILYVGRLAPHKNLELLISAISLLRTEGLEPTVVIVGDGPERRNLERLATARALDSVHFLGALESDSEVISLMKSSHVFAFPSLREGFGLAPLEASASGIPVVAVRHDNNATCELIQDGLTGVITPPEPRAFANALKSLLEDQATRGEMGRNASDAAEAFDWGRVVDRTEAVYHQVASGQSKELRSRAAPQIG
jgi:glycosyltransferase involved in cell wall biosynthesis